MNREQAHQLLNAVVDGSDVPEESITEALKVTGDLDWWGGISDEVFVLPSQFKSIS